MEEIQGEIEISEGGERKKVYSEEGIGSEDGGGSEECGDSEDRRW